MAKGLDLNKIKDEIDTRKKEKNMVSSQLGESVGRGVAPRDEFLHGLQLSLKTGTATAATNLIKVVENKAIEKKGGVAVHQVNETPVAQPARTVQMSPERDEQLFADLEKKKNQTLAESIEGFSGANTSTAPTAPTVNYNGQQLLTSVPATAQVAAPTGGVQINEQVLVESVKQIVNSHLTDNLGPVFEEAIKGTIIEMYAVERIKEVLVENKDLITEVVKDVIREIQERAKAKQKPQS